MSQTHYFSPDPDQARQRITIDYSLGGRDFHFTTDRGVFSRTKVDYGTDILLRVINAETTLRPDATALDLGCGYGVISVVLQSFHQSQKWTGIDVNPFAVELAQENARRHQVQIHYFAADGIDPAWGTYDLIVSNPPIRTGKKVIYRLFREAYDSLTVGGFLYLVIRRKQGSESAVRFLEEYFSEVITIEKKGGYHIIRCCR